jgi:hypothetical protein
VRDRDRVYGGEFAARACGLGIETVLTPIQAPRANAIAAGCSARTPPAYAAYCNAGRPHRGLHLERPLAPRRDTSVGTGPIRARC